MGFYNTYRPKAFSELVGQGQVVQILQNQVRQRQLAHSYLLCGASGSGKTTVARLIAMSANCANVNGEPCGVCDSCRLIREGHHWDVLEVDCGRFRGIEDVKDLCFKANFAPLGSRKVYILDEVHQITEAGFGALLKLLEEPPPHLILILTTTEVNRIPDTIQSRCQMFPFLKVPDGAIVEKLKRIAQAERIPLDDRHAQFIAQSSNGNVRKAENLLEQCCFAERTTKQERARP